MAYTVAGLRSYYLAKWNNMVITRPASIEQGAKMVLAGKTRYQEIERQTGVPWKMVGVIHLRESSCNFRTHLHNGDPLTARTYHVPAGRPLRGTAPFTWEYSAVDALTMQGLTKIKEWPIEQMAFSLEAYNGWGYRYRGVPSAYLWSGTNQYASGKYVADGVWDSSAVDVQVGVMAVLKRLMELTGEPASGTNISLPSAIPNITTTSVPEIPIVVSKDTAKAEIPKPTNKEMNQVSRKFFLTDIVSWFVKGTLGLVAMVQALDLAAIQMVSSWVSAIKTFANDNGLYICLLSLIALGLYLTVIKNWMKEDVQKGRSTPSGNLGVSPAIPGAAGVPEANLTPVQVPDVLPLIDDPYEPHSEPVEWPHETAEGQKVLLLESSQ